MKKYLLLLCIAVFSAAGLCAEKASFVVEGYSYSRKTDRKAIITAAVLEDGVAIPGVATLSLKTGSGKKPPSLSGNKMVLNLDNELLIVNAPGVKINTVKLRYATGQYGQNTQINWGADNRNNDKQFSRDKGSGETGSNIRTQEYVDASQLVRLIAKGEVHLNFVEVEYETNATSAVVGIAGDDSNEPEEFFNLQGVRIPKSLLQPGIYIRRQGSTTEKILIR